MASLKPTNYYQVSAWMITDLKLKSNELNAFAIIYGFSQDGQNAYTGSLNYLSEWLGTSKQTTINVLDKLVEKNYILKEQYEVNRVKFNKFKANVDYINQIIFKKINFTTGQNFIQGVVKNFDEGSQKIIPRVVKNFDECSQKIRPNNNIYKYIDRNINNNISDDDLRFREICNLYKREINRTGMDCSPNEISEIRRLTDFYGYDNFEEAVKIAVIRNVKNLSFIEGILKNMVKDKNDVDIPSEYTAIPY